MIAAPHDAEPYILQKEAAKLLRVSVSYLRKSDCPKTPLPPARGKRPLIRYLRTEVLAWAATHRRRATEPQRRALSQS